jgi:hypothetical protein
LDDRARRAQSLLNDPLVKEAFETLEKDLLSSWRNSGTRDTETRESLWLAMRLLDRIHTHLQSILETGQMAEKMQQYQL